MSAKVFWYCHECGRRHTFNHVGVGSLHRAWMRLIHSYGLCSMRALGVEPGRFRCDWCGMNGRNMTHVYQPGGKVL